MLVVFINGDKYVKVGKLKQNLQSHFQHNIWNYIINLTFFSMDTHISMFVFLGVCVRVLYVAGHYMLC